MLMFVRLGHLFSVAANSPLLKHLKEAGLLTEVSSLLVRAKVRDEAQLKKIQQQAKGMTQSIPSQVALVGLLIIIGLRFITN